MQGAKNRFPQGEAQDRGPHAGGLVEGVGCQQVFSRHHHRNCGLFRGGKKLGQDRLQEGHAHQPPVAPGETKPDGPWQKTERCEHHQQGSYGIAGHHHPTLGPAVSPDPSHRSQQHGRDGVRHKDACGQQGDHLGACADVKAVTRRHFRQHATSLPLQQQVLIDQEDHQHDVKLVRQLGKDLAQPEFSEVVEAKHGFQAALPLRIAAGGQSGFRGGEAGSAQGAIASRP